MTTPGAPSAGRRALVADIVEQVWGCFMLCTSTIVSVRDAKLKAIDAVAAALAASSLDDRGGEVEPVCGHSIGEVTRGGVCVPCTEAAAEPVAAKWEPLPEGSSIACFRCGDGYTFLYCLNCAQTLLAAEAAPLPEGTPELREALARQIVDAVLGQFFASDGMLSEGRRRSKAADTVLALIPLSGPAPPPQEPKTPAVTEIVRSMLISGHLVDSPESAGWNRCIYAILRVLSTPAADREQKP